MNYSLFIKTLTFIMLSLIPTLVLAAATGAQAALQFRKSNNKPLANNSFASLAAENGNGC